jgi:hypothetical protein
VNCSHSIKFSCQVDSEEQRSWTESMPLVDEEGSARTVNFDWLCASPRTRWFALKSAYKLNFRHDGTPASLPAGEERRTKKPPFADAQSPEDIKTRVNELVRVFLVIHRRARRREAQAPPVLAHHNRRIVGVRKSDSDQTSARRAEAQIFFGFQTMPFLVRHGDDTPHGLPTCV